MTIKLFHITSSRSERSPNNGRMEGESENKEEKRDLNDATSDKPKFMLKLSRAEYFFVCYARTFHFVSLTPWNPDTFHFVEEFWILSKLMCHQKLQFQPKKSSQRRKFEHTKVNRSQWFLGKILICHSFSTQSSPDSSQVFHISSDIQCWCTIFFIRPQTFSFPHNSLS